MRAPGEHNEILEYAVPYTQISICFRFHVRGADLQGNVANFVETEQFVIYEDMRCSFVQVRHTIMDIRRYYPYHLFDLFLVVQVRGSIPLLWSQKPNLKYKPAMIIGPKNEDHVRCLLITTF